MKDTGQRSSWLFRRVCLGICCKTNFLVVANYEPSLWAFLALIAEAKFEKLQMPSFVYAMSMTMEVFVGEICMLGQTWISFANYIS